MAINKIEFDSTILIDLTGDTVTRATLAQGIVAHDKSGNQIVGEFVTTNGSVSQDDDGYIVLNDGDGSGTPLVPLTVTQNGTYTAPSNTGYTPVTVSVNTVPTLQSKTASPTESVQTIVADSGYDGLSSVEVGAIASDYIGTSVPRKSASDLVASGSFVNVEAGYYSSGVSKAVNAGSAAVPATNLAFAPAISIDTTTGVITASVSGSSNISPTITSGYVSSGVSGKISVTGSNSLSLAIQAAKTLTPTTASQLAVASGRYTTGSVYVGAIPSAYVIPTGTSTITSNGTFDVSPYKSVSVSVSADSVTDDYVVNMLTERKFYSVGEASIQESYFTNLSLVSSGALCGFRLSYYSFPLCTTIGRYGFANCTIPSDTYLQFPICTNIGNRAFTDIINPFALYLPECTSIGTEAFADTYLSSIYAPKLSSVTPSAFIRCRVLTSAEFPNVAKISQSAFYYCASLVTAVFPSCTIINNYAFASCSNLETISFPLCTSIFDSVFQSCYKLQEAIFPSCLSIRQSAFYNCSALSVISFPVCSIVGSSAFDYCRHISEVNLPNCSKVSDYAFRYNFSLKTISLPVVSSIGNYAFAYCSVIESAYFLGSSVPSIGANTFMNTAFANSATLGKYGSIFVANSMLSSFQTAQYWSTYKSRMVGLTDEEIAAL